MKSLGFIHYFFRSFASTLSERVEGSESAAQNVFA